MKTKKPVIITISDDPGNALLAFSLSFKKVQRVRPTRKRKKRDIKLKKQLKIRSLPNINEVKEDTHDYCVHQVLNKEKMTMKRLRSNSFCPSALQLPSSSLIINDCANNEMTEQTKKIHREEVCLVVVFSDVFHHMVHGLSLKIAPTLLDGDSVNNATSAFYKSIDAMPNMNVAKTKKTIPLVSELVGTEGKLYSQ
ncbi:unnamed protein product [Dracunculus medinensis]|uniref:Uncharacterized protein n=1 Tax=Dracunculus medinensis TaxID=318479 RepID=A0A0N4UFT7_DRAME|nr:unnamed protein product [Dracunculus medinensis]